MFSKKVLQTVAEQSSKSFVRQLSAGQPQRIAPVDINALYAKLNMPSKDRDRFLGVVVDWSSKIETAKDREEYTSSYPIIDANLAFLASESIGGVTIGDSFRLDPSADMNTATITIPKDPVHPGEDHYKTSLCNIMRETSSGLLAGAFVKKILRNARNPIDSMAVEKKLQYLNSGPLLLEGLRNDAQNDSMAKNFFDGIKTIPLQQVQFYLRQSSLDIASNQFVADKVNTNSLVYNEGSPGKFMHVPSMMEKAGELELQLRKDAALDIAHNSPAVPQR